ncbi:MAG: ABC transporter permease subunit, partial [Planctomycetota bacterium]
MQVFLLELKLLFRDRASWVLLFLFAGSLGYGVWNGSQSAQASRDSVKKVGERVDSFEENLVPKLMARKYPASRYLFYGESAALPAAPLPYLATGQSDLSPNHDRVTLMRRHIPRGSRSEIQNPANLMAGRFDLAFVLVWLYPLFLLGLAYDLIAGDRETGTFRLALAQGVSPARILVLRAFARALPVITLAIVGTFAASVLDDSAATDLRVVLAAAIVLVYGLFWSSLAAWVNSRSRSAAGSATGLGAAWVTLVLVV